MVLKGSKDILKVKVEDCFSGLKNYCVHRGPFWIQNRVVVLGLEGSGKNRSVSLVEIYIESGIYNDLGHAPKFLLTFSP